MHKADGTQIDGVGAGGLASAMVEPGACSLGSPPRPLVQELRLHPGVLYKALSGSLAFMALFAEANTSRSAVPSPLELEDALVRLGTSVGCSAGVLLPPPAAPGMMTGV